MRQHRFRGKTREGKEVKGSLIQSKDGKLAYIGYAEPLEEDVAVIHYDEVIPETIGEVIGNINDTPEAQP